MNILVLNWRDIKHPLSGGAEISLLEHAKYWIKMGARVTWFAASFEGGKEREVIDGIEVIRRGSLFTVHLHACFYYLKNLRSTTDVIFDNFHFLPFFSPLYTRNKAIVAFINEPAKEAWFQNGHFFIGIIGFLIEPLFFIPYKNIPMITGSKSIASELLLYHFKKDLVSVVPHGIGTVRQTRKHNKFKNPVCIYLGQIAKDKGIEDAIKAFVLVKKKIPHVQLWVVGRASSEKYLQRVKKIISQTQMKKNITLFGYVTEKKKNQLLEKAWILVHPSIREGWGLNVIEANYFGTPAIGYAISGLSDSIRHNQTGILTTTNTHQELAIETISLLQDKEKYATLSKAARKFAKNFNWEKSGKQSWKIIKKVYENSKRT